jgi:4-amino-4-deoxy-L-arabinose transferase-like glycosyltransferase
MSESSFKVQRSVTGGFLIRNAFHILLGALAFLGSCILLVSTRWGIGTYPDSVVYIGIARSIFEGSGVRFFNDTGQFVPVTQFPPLYPSVIASFGIMGLDPLSGSRWLSAILFAANTILVAYIVYWATLSRGASLISSFFAQSSFPMVYIHSMALSEPLFIFLVFLGLSLLALYLHGSRPWMLYLSAVTIGLSCLARYVGIAFVLTGTVAIFCLSGREWKKRLADASNFFILASVPLVIWVCRNLWLAGNTVNRKFGFHLPPIKDLLAGTDTICLWLFPAGMVNSAPWLCLSVLVITFFLVCWLARNGLSRSKYMHLGVFWLLGYGIFLLTSWVLNDQPLYFETRHLAIAYVATMVLAVCIITQWLQLTRLKTKSWRWFIFDCLIIAISALQMVNGVLWLRYSYINGIGLASESWRNSELIKFAKSADSSIPMFSNAPDFIYTLTGNHAVMIPNKVNPYTRLPNEMYRTDITTMGKQLHDRNGVLIYFIADDRLWYLPSQNELQNHVSLQIIKTAGDGTIYSAKASAVGQDR